jgi:hypothetical protein
MSLAAVEARMHAMAYAGEADTADFEILAAARKRLLADSGTTDEKSFYENLLALVVEGAANRVFDETGNFAVAMGFLELVKSAHA